MILPKLDDLLKTFTTLKLRDYIFYSDKRVQNTSTKSHKRNNHDQYYVDCKSKYGRKTTDQVPFKDAELNRRGKLALNYILT